MAKSNHNDFSFIKTLHNPSKTIVFSNSKFMKKKGQPYHQSIENGSSFDHISTQMENRLENSLARDTGKMLDSKVTEVGTALSSYYDNGEPISIQLKQSRRMPSSCH